MTRTRWAAKIAVFLVAAMLGFGLVPAAAQASTGDSCSARVIDATEDPKQKLDIKLVQMMIDQAEAHGSTIYVRAFQQAPAGGGLGEYWQRFYTEICPDLGVTVGDHVVPHPGVVMLAYSVDDNQSQVFFGSDYADDLLGNPSDAVLLELRAFVEANEPSLGVSYAVAMLDYLTADESFGPPQMPLLRDTNPIVGTVAAIPGVPWVAVLAVCAAVMVAVFLGAWLARRRPQLMLQRSDDTPQAPSS